MKKYLLTFILSIIGFIGFSSASYTFTSSESDGFYFYSPSDITLTDDLDISVLNYSCSFDTCVIQFDGTEYDENWMFPSCTITYSNGNISLDGTCNFSSQTIESSNPNSTSSAFSSITIGDVSENVGGGDTTEGGLIIQNGTSELSPIITSIFSVMGEFIPYVVYIGIGILLCTLGFTAIKRLMNRLSGKITKYFK